MRQLVQPLLLSFDRIMARMRVSGEADRHARKNRLPAVTGIGFGVGVAPGLRTVVSVVEVKEDACVAAVTQAAGETVYGVGVL